MEITRFAPSPTGNLHLGGARTALFAWLHARTYKGKFLIRFEDTDKERSKKEYVDSIISSLHWLGIEPDENPIFQSERTELHKEAALSLLNSGKAYSCDCTPDQLKKMRDNQIKNKLQPRYDGFNRDKNLSHKEGNVIRFKMPENGTTSFEDKILGTISVNNKELDDFIILRSDSSPTYNFCAALDDIDMNISTVIRGDDHITNTLKQINILNALNVSIPKYAHLPMVLSSDGKRLSKRDGAVDINDYKQMGYTKEAMVNYLIKLGWSYKDQEIFSVNELMSLFNLDNVNSSAAKFSEDLLNWYNNKYINMMDIKDIEKSTLKFTGSDFSKLEKGREALEIFKKNANTFQDISDQGTYLFLAPDISEELLNTIKVSKEIIKNFFTFIKEVAFEDKSNIEEGIKKFIKQEGIKFPELGKPVRIILTGKINAPSISDLLYLLGKEESLDRIKRNL